jgi:hypothetical protein
MLATIILIVLAVVLIALFVKVVQGGFRHGGGGSVNVIAGATQDLMTRDQRKAVEVIVKQQAGEKEEEQTSGEPKDSGERK